MLYKPRLNKVKRKVISSILILIALFLLVFVLFEFKARDLVYISVDNELEIVAQTAMDDAVIEVLSQYVTDFNNLVISESLEDSKITSLRTDSKKINVLKSEISNAITENIRQGRTVTVSVPVGAFTGLVLLSSTGPELPVNLMLGGSCTTDIKSEFTSAGYNQTVHHIYLYVEADVSLSCPIINHETTVVSKYELCQTVIVGGIPNMLADLR